jgi:hypothetical protein
VAGMEVGMAGAGHTHNFKVKSPIGTRQCRVPKSCFVLKPTLLD